MESSSPPTAPFPVMPLIAMGLGVLILANDFSALNVALPQIEKDFDAQVSTVQWVVNAYNLTFASVMLASSKCPAFMDSSKRTARTLATR